MKKNIRLLLIEGKKAILPEQNYYINFLNEHNTKIKIEKSNFHELENKEKFDYICIPLMYISLSSIISILKNKKKGLKIIVDIRSGSVGLLRGLKNSLKIIFLFIIRPNFLIFLNQSVKKIFFKYTRLLNCEVFLIDMPIPVNYLKKSKEDYLSKKYRIIVFIKSKKDFYDFLKIRKKIKLDKTVNKDLIISKNKGLSVFVNKFINKKNLSIDFKNQLNFDEYMRLLESSYIHFIPYPNISPFNHQTSTRLFDSVLKKVFVITLDSKINNYFIDYFEYRNYAYLYSEIDNTDNIIDIEIVNRYKEIEIDKKVIEYMYKFDNNLSFVFEKIFK